jgi:hypothetical protein
MQVSFSKELSKQANGFIKLNQKNEQRFNIVVKTFFTSPFFVRDVNKNK